MEKPQKPLSIETMRVTAYPAYSRPERIADAVAHALGVGLTLVGVPLLIVFASLHLSGGSVAAVSVYGAFVLTCFVASYFYHFPPSERLRPLFLRIDQAMIFLKIAGTYTPLVVILGTTFAYVLLGLVWGLAILGAIARLSVAELPRSVSRTLYLTLGWMSLLLMGGLFQVLPVAALILIGAGGVLYTVGALNYGRRQHRYESAIWHGFVLAASACFFTAIALSAFMVTPGA